MKKFEMFKYFSFKLINSNTNWINQIEKFSCFSSHLTEHISNFGAVSTQIRVTLWKEDHLYRTKDKQYPVKLMRPEDRLDYFFKKTFWIIFVFYRISLKFSMDSLLPLLHEIADANNDKIAKYGDMILYTCVEYD